MYYDARNRRDLHHMTSHAFLVRCLRPHYKETGIEAVATQISIAINPFSQVASSHSHNLKLPNPQMDQTPSVACQAVMWW